MPTRVIVDFGYVEPAHAEIDARLVNWARWSSDRRRGYTSSMFRLYRTPKHRDWAVDRPAPVDAIDGMRMQVAIAKLPTLHRSALAWGYIRRDNPRAMAQQLGQTLQGLADLLRDGRQMLINRGM